MICLPKEIVNYIIFSAFLHEYHFGWCNCKAKFLYSEIVRRACCLPTDIKFGFLLLELIRGLIGSFLMVLFGCVAFWHFALISFYFSLLLLQGEPCS